jgi:hypothetical protein
LLRTLTHETSVGVGEVLSFFSALRRSTSVQSSHRGECKGVMAWTHGPGKAGQGTAELLMNWI